MRVLVACEFSGIIRREFAIAEHNVTSVDLLPAEMELLDGEGNHIQHDLTDYFPAWYAQFDLMIAHPPCTYLAVSGARWFKGREKEQVQALRFFRFLMDAQVPRKCIENPVGVPSTKIRKPDQIIQPWQYGEPETKATCLWLLNLPLLKPTRIIPEMERKHSVWTEPPSPERWKNRSRSFHGIAVAMANQWGKLTPTAELEAEVQ